jgi:hypothetical protein
MTPKAFCGFFKVPSPFVTESTRLNAMFGTSWMTEEPGNDSSSPASYSTSDATLPVAGAGTFAKRLSGPQHTVPLVRSALGAYTSSETNTGAATSFYTASEMDTWAESALSAKSNTTPINRWYADRSTVFQPPQHWEAADQASRYRYPGEQLMRRWLPSENCWEFSNGTKIRPDGTMIRGLTLSYGQRS